MPTKPRGEIATLMKNHCQQSAEVAFRQLTTSLFASAFKDQSWDSRQPRFDLSGMWSMMEGHNPQLGKKSVEHLDPEAVQRYLS